MDNLQSDLNLKNLASLSVKDLERELENAKVREAIVEGDVNFATKMRMARLLAVRQPELASATEYRKQVEATLAAVKIHARVLASGKL
jgi:hypothetical protein